MQGFVVGRLYHSVVCFFSSVCLVCDGDNVKLGRLETEFTFEIVKDLPVRPNNHSLAPVEKTRNVQFVLPNEETCKVSTFIKGTC